ncbi:DUF1080 domain-containing protein [Prolixibacteraceae bacterium JC049]|nr:DUF1080 domain-containing protein [Prolixibacteraceae bacterium JC049]
MRRNYLKSIINILLVVLICTSVANAKKQPNKLTKKEERRGWTLLFDGKSTTGWRGANKANFPVKGWIVKEGKLIILGGSRAGDIISENKYSDFDLRIEFMVKEHKSNSGIKYFVSEDGYKKGLALGIEYQTGNKNPGQDLKTGLASAYDIFSPEFSKVNPVKPGNWNKVRIVARGKKVQHWLNGKKVLEYKRGSDVFKEAVAKSKFRDIPNFGELEEGHILLQDHNDEVAFRNIKILEL